MPKAIQVYKFLRSEFLHHILEGETLRLSTLDHFRQFESQGWIGDRDEGVSRHRIDHWHIPETTDANTKVLRSLGIDARNSTDLTFTNVRFENRVVEQLIYCTSFGDLTDLTRKMCDRESDSYDACLAVWDLRKLAWLTYRSGVVLDGRQREQLANLVGPPVVGRVQYGPTEVVVPDQPIRHPSPFWKGTQFADQQEARVAFEVRGRLPGSVVTVHVPGLRDLVSLVFRDRIGGSAD